MMTKKISSSCSAGYEVMALENYAAASSKFSKWTRPWPINAITIMILLLAR